MLTMRFISIRNKATSLTQINYLFSLLTEKMASMCWICSALRHYFFSRSQAHLNCLCYKKLSHFNFETISKIYVNELVREMPKMKFHTDNLCSTCVKGKQTKSSFMPRSCFSINDPFNLLHMHEIV